MAAEDGDETSSPRLRLTSALVAELRSVVPELSVRTLAAVMADVPPYRDSVGAQRRLIETAVDQTITVFIDLVADGRDPDTSAAQDPALDGAFSLGQAEARAGRSSEMLLSAYRVGARTVWRRWSGVAVGHHMAGDQLAVFAELIFAYMDRLSASAVAGHARELARTGLARQRARESLVRALMNRAGEDVLLAEAERAEWPPPRTLTAVAVPSGRAAGILKTVDSRSLELPDDIRGGVSASMAVVLVPDVGGSARDRFLSSLSVDGAVVGPPRTWMQAAQSVRRVERTVAMDLRSTGVTDTDLVLAELVLGADEEALADLQAKVLAPLVCVRPAVRDNLVSTLRSWLLHHGRRDDIAADLYVHPGTVRYRLGRLRELFGDGLTDPRTIFELTVALGAPPTKAAD